MEKLQSVGNLFGIAGRSALENVGGDYHKLNVGAGSFDLIDEHSIDLLEFIGRNAVLAADLVPSVVHSDIDACVVGLQIDEVSLDPCINVDYAVSADASVYKLVFTGSIESEGRLDKICISVSHVIEFGAVSAAICYRIALKQYSF